MSSHTHLQLSALSVRVLRYSRMGDCLSMEQPDTGHSSSQPQIEENSDVNALSSATEQRSKLETKSLVPPPDDAGGAGLAAQGADDDSTTPSDAIVVPPKPPQRPHHSEGRFGESSTHRPYFSIDCAANSTEENGANLDQMTNAEVDMLDLMHPLNWEDGVHRSKNVR